MSLDDFAYTLIEAGPLTEALLDADLDDWGELQGHGLLSDLRRAALSAFDRGDRETSRAIVECVTRAFLVADDQLKNAIDVSFIEDTGWSHDPEVQDFVDSWPAELRVEIDPYRPQR
jgi:hypothetical protein